jgi:hypothetical protein
MSHRDADHFVYYLLSKRSSILYIGCSMNLNLRLAEHRRNALWGHRVDSVAIDGPHDFTTARRLEAEAIAAFQPPYNTEGTPRHHRGRRWNRPPRLKVARA